MPPLFRLEAVTLRVGPVAAEFDGALEEAWERGDIFLQISEVTGEPVINDDGATGAVRTLSAFPLPETMAMADDYITGERYRPIFVASAGKLPTDSKMGSPNSGGPE